MTTANINDVYGDRIVISTDGHYSVVRCKCGSEDRVKNWHMQNGYGQRCNECSYTTRDGSASGRKPLNRTDDDFRELLLTKHTKVQHDNIDTPCWEWTGAKQHKTLYARVRLNRINGKENIKYGHRLSYELFTGPTEGLHVCHKCDNPICINPDHLFLGTDQDNHTDKVQKDRQITGEDHGQSILTEDIVIKLKTGELKPSTALAEQLFGHKESSHLHAIKNGKCWKHLNHHIPK